MKIFLQNLDKQKRLEEKSSVINLSTCCSSYDKINIAIFFVKKRISHCDWSFIYLIIWMRKRRQRSRGEKIMRNEKLAGTWSSWRIPRDVKQFFFFPPRRWLRWKTIATRFHCLHRGLLKQEILKPRHEIQRSRCFNQAWITSSAQEILHF